MLCGTKANTNHLSPIHFSQKRMDAEVHTPFLLGLSSFLLGHYKLTLSWLAHNPNTVPNPNFHAHD